MVSERNVTYWGGNLLILLTKVALFLYISRRGSPQILRALRALRGEYIKQFNHEDHEEFVDDL